MSRDPYGASNLSSAGGGGNRSPRSARRVGELPTVDRSPSRNYPTTHSAGTRGSPIGRKSGRPTRSGNTSPEQHGYSSSYGGGQHLGSPYYGREDDLGSPIMMDDRGRSTGPGAGHHRSRSASRPAMSSSNPMSTRYQSLDRAGDAVGHDREFMPIREPRERSLDRGAARERSLERGLYLEEELYGGGSRSARQSPNPHMMSSGGRDPGGGYINELQQQNNDLQRELGNFKKELELTNQKLGSSMHSIKTFWSPELKKERALRKEESAKYSLINDQLKLLNSENQKQAMLVRQLEEELRLRMRNPSMEMQQQMELLFSENEHLTREIAILRETIKELELRIETQKQTLQARDESIKKLLEMLQNKGVGGKMLDEERVAFETLQARLIESEDKLRHYETVVRNRDQELSKTKRELKATNETLRALQTQLEKAFHTQNCSGPSNSTLTAILETKDARIATLEKEVALLELELDRIRECGCPVRDSVPVPDATTSLHKHEFSFKRQLEEFRAEIQRRDQEILAMSAKMKTLEEQHQDYQRHIAVLKESLCAKEEHYNMLQADVEELRQRLEEKNRHIEKKTVTATQATQERNRLNNELNELRDHMDIKDRKINVLQRKLDLHEAKQKLANGAARAGEETTALKMQLEEQKKQLEEQRRKLDEHKKGLDSKSRQLEEKEKSIADVDQKLKKRKEKLDQLEAQIQRSGAAAGRGGDSGGLQKRLGDTERELESHRKELEKSREDAQRSQVEMERLLQLVQMSQEEQNSKEKMIRDLQDALKNAQAKLRSQQTANAQMEETRRREEVEMQDKAVDIKDDSNEDVVRELREEVEKKSSRVSELEQDVRELEDVLIDHGKVGELQGLREEVEKRGQRIADLEQDIHELQDLLIQQTKGIELQDLNREQNKYSQIVRGVEGRQINHSKAEDFNLDNEVEKYGEGRAEQEQDVREFESKLLAQNKDEELQHLRQEVEHRDKRILDLEEEMGSLEAALGEQNDLAELEELVGVVRHKNDRIEELEEALRESVRITADREMVLHQEEVRRKQIMEKVGKLEQRLLSLQTAHALRCGTCRPLVTRLRELERRLTQLLAERRAHLQDLAHMKQEALEAAISEKDAHVALLEVSGIRTARQAEEADQLKADRRRLMDRLKEENEKSVQLLQEYSITDLEPLDSAVLNLEDTEEDQIGSNTSRHNGHSDLQNKIEQDSSKSISPNTTPPQ